MANFDDEDPVLGDITAEDLVKGMKSTTMFVAKTFLEPKHYQTIHQTLARKWDRCHSLSAALKLMENYGVTLSEEEQKKLEGMDEVQQISKLVSKMPQQSNDQFQQFFLQLQLLVSTAMRVRRSLEEGKPHEVSQALEDADTTGIASYILNVAIVQAGSEVAMLKNQFAGWTSEANSKMGRLLRGQQDNITAQKQLKLAEQELNKQNREQSVKAGKVVIRFWGGNNVAVKQLVIQGWAYASKMLRLEATCRLDYADRLQDLEDNLAKVKHGQVSKGEIIVLRKIQQDNIALMGTVFDIWRGDADNTVFMRECGDKVKAMEEKLAQTKESQKANAQKVLSKMTMANDQGLLSNAVKGWTQVRQDSIRQKTAQQERVNAESKLDAFAKKKSDEAKYIIQQFAAESATGLVGTCMTNWIELWAEKKEEAEVAEKMYKSRSKMENFSERNKKATGSVMNRAAEHLVTLQLGRCFNAWKLDAKMELTIRTYHAKIEAKKGQLVGVQSMFRNFAAKLEQSQKEENGKESSRVFDNNSSVERAKKKGMVKGEGSVSLPNINQKQGYGGGKESSSGRSGKAKQLSHRSRDSRPDTLPPLV